MVIIACTTSRDEPAAQTASSTVPAVPGGDTLRQRADSFYLAGNAEGARRLWALMLADAERRGDSAAVAQHLTSLGLAARKLSDFVHARELLERSAALKERLGMRADLFRSVNALGLLAWQEGRLIDAAALLQRAAGVARAVGDSLSEAKAAGNMGLVLKDLGDHDGARAGFQRQLSVGRGANDTLMTSRALNNLGMLDAALGDPLAAVAALGEALAMYRATGDTEGEENALGQLAIAYDALGDPRRAFALLDSAVAISRRTGLKAQEGEDVKLLADLYRDAGQPHMALEHYARAQRINRELRLPKQEGEALRDEARARAALGQETLARTRAAEALRIHRARGFRMAELEDRLLLLELARDDEPRGAANGQVRAATRLADSLGTDLARARVALTMARLADLAGQAQRVLKVLDAARAPLAGAASGTEWEVLALRARAHARLHQYEAAAAAGENAVAALERVRGRYAFGALRTSFITDKTRVYADLLVVLLRLGREGDAFQVADAARGRALLEHLAAVRRDVARTGGGMQSLAAGERLLRRIDKLTRELRELGERSPQERGGDDEGQSRMVSERLAQLRAEYESLLMRDTPSDRASAAVLGASHLDVSEVRSALHAGEALVEYFMAPDRLLIFVATRDTVRSIQAPMGAGDLAGRVRLARELVGRRPTPTGAAREVLQSLHRALVRPMLDAGVLAGVQRLVIVPHAALTYLPFSALIDERTGDYLVERFPLLQVSSAGALPAVRRRGAASAAHARAAPVAFAPFPVLLPNTAAEMRAVRDALGREALAFLGSRATEGTLRGALAGEGVVHVATHGVMNVRNPMFSRVELAVAPGRPPDDDGRLEVHEVLGLRVRSPLVFLSGCETGVGVAWSTHFEQREDYATLAQSFLYAGARDVVATLWRIEDAGAAVFARHFYRELRRYPAPEALAAAQRAMASDSRFGAPYYWAGYQLHGSGGSGPFAQIAPALSVYRR